jgi:hypothetical protein
MPHAGTGAFMASLYAGGQSRIENLGDRDDVVGRAIASAITDPTSVSPYDDEDFNGDMSPSINLVPPLLGLLVIGAVVYLLSAAAPPGGQAGGELSSCATIANEHDRLACFDRLATPTAPAKGAVAPFGSQAGERP